MLWLLSYQDGRLPVWLRILISCDVSCKRRIGEKNTWPMPHRYPEIYGVKQSHSGWCGWGFCVPRTPFTFGFCKIGYKYILKSWMFGIVWLAFSQIGVLSPLSYEYSSCSPSLFPLIRVLRIFSTSLLGCVLPMLSVWSSSPSGWFSPPSVWH
jgi:hypothetical protein